MLELNVKYTHSVLRCLLQHLQWHNQPVRFQSQNTYKCFKMMFAWIFRCHDQGLSKIYFTYVAEQGL